MENLSSVLNIFLIVNEFTDRRMTNDKMLRLCSMTAIGLVWFKVFYWMRLFEKHALFMNILYKTMYGISEFLLMLAIIIGLFTNMTYIIVRVDHDYTLR